MLIDSVTAAGAYTVSGTINGNYEIGDLVTIAGCTHADSLINNGEYKIHNITSQVITLRNKYDDSSALSGLGTVKDGCKISKVKK